MVISCVETRGQVAVRLRRELLAGVLTVQRVLTAAVGRPLLAVVVAVELHNRDGGRTRCATRAGGEVWWRFEVLKKCARLAAKLHKVLAKVLWSQDAELREEVHAALIQGAAHGEGEYA